MAKTNPSKKHPYLTGNFAPVHIQLSLQPCEVLGSIPNELMGGQYIRNGGNPLPDGNPHRAMHWFDGHGMLSAVYFLPVNDRKGADIEVLYSNQYVLTDVFLAESKYGKLRSPILPSIAPMLNPEPSLLSVCKIIMDVLRAVWLVFCSWMSYSSQSIKRISVANTSIVFHNGRILATCESGPPMRVFLPDMKTVGWFDGHRAEGEHEHGGKEALRSAFADKGLLGFFYEWTTGHPHIDPVTGEMITFHSTFFRPFVRYSVLARTSSTSAPGSDLVAQPVPGISSSKLMHDFGVSHQHTVIIDMPLSLNPFNLVYKKPIISFNPKGQTRFGLFPRYMPHEVKWFTTEASCIFHTVNTWDEKADNLQQMLNMLVCRMTGPSIVFASGNLPVPSIQATSKEECCLYYYQFAVDGSRQEIMQQWALSAIPFEFPHVPKHLAMSATRFCYGCSVVRGNYADQIGDAGKVSSLAKVNVQGLIARGLANPPTPITGFVDNRSVEEILAADIPDDLIQIFPMPEGLYAQECTFVPRMGSNSEDDGWLLTFVFDESQLDAEGNVGDEARSELWAIDAKTMKDVVMRVRLPQRVPYGLHGNWFSKEEIADQRPVEEFRA